MLNSISRYLQQFFLATAVLGTIGCASKQALTGGPKDTTPAAIVATVPANGTTLYAGSSVVFRFDDYVDRSILNAISVLPNVRFTSSYAGDEITVRFADDLERNTTYTVTLGTDWTDLRQNRPGAATSIVFSTGPEIDTGMITGYVRAASYTNVFLFCYGRADTLPPTFSPRTTTPRYRLPIGDRGEYSLLGLAHGQYRTMIVRDENRNGLLDNTEDFVIASSDVHVGGDSAKPLYSLIGAPIDRDGPTISRARALSNQRILVQLSEPAAPVTTWDNVFTVSTGSGSALAVNAVIPSETYSESVQLCMNQPLDTSRIVVSLRSSTLRDSSGNTSADTVARITLRGTISTDTVQLRVLPTTPLDSAKGVPVDAPILVRFSDAVDTSGLRVTLWHTSAAAATPVVAAWSTVRTLEVRPTQLRVPRSWYNVELSLSNILSVLGKPIADTTIRLRFETAERMSDPGSMSGVIKETPVGPANGDTVVLRLLTQRGQVAASVRAIVGAPFLLQDVPAGSYTVDVVRTSDGSLTYRHGDHSPFRFADQWWPTSVSVTIRSRWSVDDVVVSPGERSVLR